MDFGYKDYDLSRCQQLLEEERYEEAYELATELLARDPASLQVVSSFCEAALEVGQAAKAVRACRGYFKGGRAGIEIMEWLVHAQWDLHLTEQCQQSCINLLRRDPGNYHALDYGLAALMELGDLEGGKEIIELASRQEDDPHLMYQTAVARMMRGEEEWARGVFERFLQEDPEEVGTYINLMRIHHLAERYDKVEELYQEASRRGLDHEDLHFNMGLALKARKRDREAAPYFVKTVRRSNEIPDAHFHLAQILRSEGHPRLAMAMLQREMMVDDTQPGVHAEMAWCAEDIGEYEEAVRMIRAAVERAPDWGIYQHSLAELMLKAEQDSEEAEGIARRAVKLDPEHAAGWQVLGRLAAEREDYSDAEQMLRKAVAAKDSTAEDEGWLGLLLADSDRRQAARPFLERAARTFPFWTPVGDALGRIRGHALRHRFEVRLAGRDPEGWYRVLYVVATDESGARSAAMKLPATDAPAAAEIVEEIRPLGFEVDHEEGVVWDSGRSRTRFPRPPQES